MKKIIAALLLTTTITPIAHAELIDLNAGGNVSEMTPSRSELGSNWDENDINLKMVQEAWDKFKQTDTVRTFKWTKYKTFKTRLRVNMYTMIVFPEDVTAFTIGNDQSFQALTMPNRLNIMNIKANHSGIDTDLKAIGKSGKIYNFYLRSDPVDSPEPPTLTVYVEVDYDAGIKSMISKGSPFYAGEEAGVRKTPLSSNEREEAKRNEDIEAAEAIKAMASLPKKQADYLKTLPDAINANVNYKITGEKDIAPFAVYDDGMWTYFDFRGGLASDRLPVIYKVVDGYDSVVNTRMEKGFLIAESLSPEGWTLRNGDKYVCVRSREDLGFKYQMRKKRISSPDKK